MVYDVFSFHRSSEPVCSLSEMVLHVSLRSVNLYSVKYCLMKCYCLNEVCVILIVSAHISFRSCEPLGISVRKLNSENSP